MACPSVPREVVLASTFALLVLLTRSMVFIFTPLYLDSLTPVTTAPHNTTHQIPVSNDTAMLIYQQIDPLCAIVFSMGFDTMVLGVMLLIIRICFPQRITERETKYPKKGCLVAGGSQGLSSLIFLYACSGARTAPYLQAVLGNFHIPITFTLRYTTVLNQCTVCIETRSFVDTDPKRFRSILICIDLTQWQRHITSFRRFSRELLGADNINS